MNQNINYTIALICLTAISLAAIGGVVYTSGLPGNSALPSLVGLAGVAVGAIAGVVKQPKESSV